VRAGPTESLIQGLHQSLFRAEKRIGLVLFGKGTWFPLAGAVRP
jgi:aspartokinase/homoserine dehydrogenase 2